MAVKTLPAPRRTISKHRAKRSQIAWMLMLVLLLTGCHPTQPFYFGGDGDLSHFINRATEIDYKWTWRGPVIPETKPPFKDFFMDRGGRIWVQLHQPASPVEVLNEDGEPAGQRWTEPVAYDVFETGGRYLGHVETPPGFRTIPQPLIEGDVVWAVVRQFEGEPSVVRFRIDH